jgi:hypothetical protein
VRQVAIWVLAAVLTGRALAWDPIGHMLVCQSAYDQLTPEAKAAVEASLAEFNKKKNTDYTFVTVGCWMDDIRGTHKEFAPWHFIDLPYNRDGEPFPVAWQVNALWGIRHCTAIIKGERTDSKVDKDQALVMLVHLVGDIHQPLHTINRHGDAGGNKVVVPNIEDAMVAAFPNRRNLHYFWDSAYRRVMKDGKVVESIVEPPSLPSEPAKGHAQALPIVVEHAARLAKSYLPEKYPATGTPEEWVRESHAQGYDNVYQILPGGDGANPATLDQAYVDNARTLTEQKLIQGGRRLAALLNELYK